MGEYMWEHADLLIAVVAMLAGLAGAVAMGGVHVGRITTEVKSIGKTIADGFRQNNEDHKEIRAVVDEHGNRLMRAETHLEAIRGNGNVGHRAAPQTNEGSKRA